MKAVFLMYGGRRIMWRPQSMSRAMFGAFGDVGYRASASIARNQVVSVVRSRGVMMDSVCETRDGGRKRSKMWVW
jgi:hypothetical protein